MAFVGRHFSIVLLCITMYYYVLLCITMYYYVLLCIAMYYYVLLCITMYYYVLLCITMYYYVLLCITMYYYVLLALLYVLPRRSDTFLFIVVLKHVKLVNSWIFKIGYFVFIFKDPCSLHLNDNVIPSQHRSFSTPPNPPHIPFHHAIYPFPRSSQRSCLHDLKTSEKLTLDQK